METVNAALNSESDVMSVGPAFDIVYDIPFGIFGEVQGAPFVSVREALYFDEPNVDLGTPAWLQGSDPQARPFLVPKTFADFNVVPEPGSALLLGLGLAALGAIGRSPRAEGEGTSASRIG